MVSLGPGVLAGASPSGDLLVGAAEGDDAAVLRLDDDRALVLTTDFFTPIVDDPVDWGRIAAANALSDVYAMGGRPVIALNLTAWPGGTLPLSILADVLRGGASVAAQAGCLVVGGHTIDDPEPKYGMAVVGFAFVQRYNVPWTQHVGNIVAVGSIVKISQPPSPPMGSRCGSIP